MVNAYALAPPLGHNGDLHVARLPDHLLDHSIAEALPPVRGLGASHEDLRDALGAGELVPLSSTLLRDGYTE